MLLSSPSVLGPFRHSTFTTIWTATVASQIGGWMYSAASAWMMTDLNGSPFMVALVQFASVVPMFLFAIPVGAMADIVENCFLLIVGEVLITVTASVFAVVVSLGL